MTSTATTAAAPSRERTPARLRRLARPADERELLRALLLVLGLGLLARLALAAGTQGSLSDLAAFRRVHELLGADLLGFYSGANPRDGGFAWPYLPGFLPILEAAYAAADLTGIAVERLVRLPAIAADIAIAWIVQWHLGWRGASLQTRLAGAALVALGPVGIALTGAHGQIDPLQWLPALLAVVAWERLGRDRRALVAGLLIGVGVALKPPAALAGVALFALSDGGRERLRLVAAGAVVPLLSWLPFFVADSDGALSILDYQSVPGQGGLSMIVQPELAIARFAGTVRVDGFNGANDVLQSLGPLLVAAAVVLVAVLAWRRRAGAAETVTALILAVFVLSPNFLPPYLIWLVPFAILAGWTRFLLIAYALALALLPFKYLPGTLVGLSGLGQSSGLWNAWVVVLVYIPAGAALWALLAWRLVAWARPRRPAS